MLLLFKFKMLEYNRDLRFKRLKVTFSERWFSYFKKTSKKFQVPKDM